MQRGSLAPLTATGEEEAVEYENYFGGWSCCVIFLGWPLACCRPIDLREKGANTPLTPTAQGGSTDHGLRDEELGDQPAQQKKMERSMQQNPGVERAADTEQLVVATQPNAVAGYSVKRFILRSNACCEGFKRKSPPGDPCKCPKCPQCCGLECDIKCNSCCSCPECNIDCSCCSCWKYISCCWKYVACCLCCCFQKPRCKYLPQCPHPCPCCCCCNVPALFGCPDGCKCPKCPSCACPECCKITCPSCPKCPSCCGLQCDCELPKCDVKCNGCGCPKCTITCPKCNIDCTALCSEQSRQCGVPGCCPDGGCLYVCKCCPRLTALQLYVCKNVCGFQSFDLGHFKDSEKDPYLAKAASMLLVGKYMPLDGGTSVPPGRIAGLTGPTIASTASPYGDGAGADMRPHDEGADLRRRLNDTTDSLAARQQPTEMVGMRVEVVGKGEGVVVKVTAHRGKPTTHTIQFDSGQMEDLQLAKRKGGGGHKFYTVAGDADAAGPTQE